jgi:hypothetical protein
MKIIILLFFIGIIASLGSALYYMMNNQDDPTKMIKALSWRVGLSLVLFLFLMLSFYMGWITPNKTPF